MIYFKDKVPHNEDVYSSIRKMIEILSESVNTKGVNRPWKCQSCYSHSIYSPTHVTEKVLVEDALMFAEAIDQVLDDARRFGPPTKPERT
jgi:hypothetical protein